MKIYLTISISFFALAWAYSQVGIQTQNPQQIFHIDGSSSATTINPAVGAPTAIQQVDDFVVTKDGNVGIGTINPKGKLEVVSSVSTFVPPRLTAVQRNEMPLGKRPTGVMIYNLDLSRLQVNVGTDDDPVWESLDLSSTTANTSILFTKTNTQQIDGATPTNVLFETISFNNTPAGYVTMQSDNATVRLAMGKTYKIEVNMGRLLSSNAGGTICRLYNGSTELSRANIYPKSRPNSFFNTFNTMSAFITTVDEDADIQVICTRTGAGYVIVNDSDAPTWSITITN